MQRIGSRRGHAAAFPPNEDAEEDVTTTDDEGESTTDEDGDADADENASGGGAQVVGVRSQAPSRARHQQEHQARPAKRLKRDGDDDGARTTTTAAVAGHVSDRSVERGSSSSGETSSTPLRSLERRVSPPARRVVDSEAETEDEDEEGVVQEEAKVKKVEAAPAENDQRRGALEEMDRATTSSSATVVGREAIAEREKTTLVTSPVQLTRIRDLPPATNVDAVALNDILGDPLIVEMWQFNYMFDVDFLMSALDEDVRDSMRVKVVHGNWRREDVQRQMLEEWAKQYSNLEVIQAYMPEAFGTHHSKMMILIRADDSVQVVIHTANMIAKDWTNMTNAVWRSPLLPLLPEPGQPHQSTAASVSANNISGIDNVKHPIGTGQRFKIDLLRYLSAYGKRLGALTKQLVHYDFSAIHAALVASTPNRVKLDDTNPGERTSWGWVGLREVLGQIPPAASPTTKTDEHTTVAQVSSIATLDQTGAWLEHFRSVLATSKHASPSSSAPSSHPASAAPSPPSKPSTAFSSPGFQPASNPPRPSHKAAAANEPRRPALRIVFPTVADVRASLDGYRAGASIHLKTQSAAQKKQLAYLRPLLRRWNTGTTGTGTGSTANRNDLGGRQQRSMGALRSKAAPHVKTYVRYATTTTTPREAQGGGGGDGGDGGVRETTRIEWAMLTSANLSTQAWGALPAAVKNGSDSGAKGTKKGNGKQVGDDGDEKGKEVRICSWEVGVVVWPALFAEDDGESLGKEAVMVPVFGRDGPQAEDARGLSGGEKVVVGWRMPYDWPLTPYQEGDEPWSPTARHGEPDVNGCVWEGF